MESVERPKNDSTIHSTTWDYSTLHIGLVPKVNGGTEI